MDMDKRITECYHISENDAKLAEKKGTSQEWAVVRRLVDRAIYKAGYKQSVLDNEAWCKMEEK